MKSEIIAIVSVSNIIAVIHHSAILHIALRNLKISLLSKHLMHPLIFGYHPDQSLPPIEQSVC
jgi:hypothetical protein